VDGGSGRDSSCGEGGRGVSIAITGASTTIIGKGTSLEEGDSGSGVLTAAWDTCCASLDLGLKADLLDTGAGREDTPPQVGFADFFVSVILGSLLVRNTFGASFCNVAMTFCGAVCRAVSGLNGAWVVVVVDEDETGTLFFSFSDAVLL
jgi:hypothetical protein